MDFMSDMKSCCSNCKGGSIKEHFKTFYYLAYLIHLFLEFCPFKQLKNNSLSNIYKVLKRTQNHHGCKIDFDILEKTGVFIKG